MLNKELGGVLNLLDNTVPTCCQHVSLATAVSVQRSRSCCSSMHLR
jgi:hypothetical protein